MTIIFDDDFTGTNFNPWPNPDWEHLSEEANPFPGTPTGTLETILGNMGLTGAAAPASDSLREHLAGTDMVREFEQRATFRRQTSSGASPIVYRSANTAGGTGLARTINKPTGTAEWDILVAVIYSAGDPGTTTLPSGWAEWNTAPDATTTIHGRLYWKRATASEGASYTWTSTNITNWSGCILAFSGAARLGFPFTTTGVQKRTAVAHTNVTSPTKSTDVPGSFALLFASAGGAVTTTDSTYTERADRSASAPSCAAYSLATNFGSAPYEPSSTVTFSSSVSHSLLIRVNLRPEFRVSPAMLCNYTGGDPYHVAMLQESHEAGKSSSTTYHRLRIYRINAGAGTQIALTGVDITSASGTLNYNATWHMATRCVSDGGSGWYLQAKVWRDGTTEPTWGDTTASADNMAVTTTAITDTALLPYGRVGIGEVIPASSPTHNTYWDTYTLDSDDVAAGDVEQTITDTIGLTDTGEITVDTDTDTVGLTDSITTELVAVRTVTDTIGSLDSFTQVGANNGSSSDPIGISDQITVEAQAVATVTDPVALTDTVSTTQDAAATFTDQIGLIDQVLVELSTSTSDTVGIIDDQTPVSANDISTEDPVGITDTVTVTHNADATADDTVGITDSVTIELTGAGAINDTVGLVDQTSTELGSERTSTDPVGVTDTAVATSELTVTDSIGITDTSDVDTTATQAPAEPIGIVDTISTVLSIVVSTDDDLGLTDTLTALSAADRTVADTVGLTDTVIQTGAGSGDSTDPVGLTDQTSVEAQTARDQSDPVGATDTAGTVSAATQTTSDPVGITDEAVADLTIGSVNYTATLTDPIGVTDATLLATDTTITDPVTATDDTTRTAASTRSTGDTVGLVDTFAQTGATSGTSSDQVGVTDTVTAVQTTQTTVTDDITNTDTTQTAVGVHAATSDTVGLDDTTTQTGATQSTITDPISGLDEHTIATEFNRIIEDVIPVSDTTVTLTSVAFAAVFTDLLGITDTHTADRYLATLIRILLEHQLEERSISASLQERTLTTTIVDERPLTASEQERTITSTSQERTMPHQTDEALLIKEEPE